jgi:uncharacterized membrane protein
MSGVLSNAGAALTGLAAERAKTTVNKLKMFVGAYTSCSCSTMVLFMVIAIMAYQLQDKTSDKSTTYNSDNARTFIKVMIAYGVIGVLFIMLMGYFGLQTTL